MSVRRVGTRGYNEKDTGEDTEMEDELSTPTLPRITGRQSISERAKEAETMQTPYANLSKLQQLAGIIEKPSTPFSRDAISGPASIQRAAKHSTQPRSHISGARKIPLPVSAKKGAPTTPHAIKALLRRAAKFTPAHDRRRSGRMQRETPRDALRNLSRILARTTQPTEPSPLSHRESQDQEDELGDDIIMHEPRFSLNFESRGEDEEDDSFHMQPPRLSLPLDDDDHTGRSLELGRHLISGSRSGRLSAWSIGTLSMGDRFGDTTELQLETIAETPATDCTPRYQMDDSDDDLGDLDGQVEPGGDTQDLRRVIIERSAVDQNRRSDLGPWDLLEHTVDTTFGLVPPSNRIPLPYGDTVDAYDDLNHLQTATVLAGSLSVASNQESRPRVPKPLKTSRQGISYPSLPVGVIKSLSSTFARSAGLKTTNMGKESLEAIMDASDWFFEQLGEDLGAYAGHAGRRMIDDKDVSTVMKRQRQVTTRTTLFSLARTNLPRELLQVIRMTPE